LESIPKRNDSHCSNVLEGYGTQRAPIQNDIGRTAVTVFQA